MLANRHSQQPGFTLLEVLFALFLFAAASAMLVQAALNAVRATEAVRTDSNQEQLFRFVLRTVMAIEEREELEDGGEIELPDDSNVTWEVEVEESKMVDLYRVVIQLELDAGNFGSSGEDVSRSYQVYLYRPEWEPEDGNRDEILENRRKNLEDRREAF